MLNKFGDNYLVFILQNAEYNSTYWLETKKTWHIKLNKKFASQTDTILKVSNFSFTYNVKFYHFLMNYYNIKITKNYLSLYIRNI